MHLPAALTGSEEDPSLMKSPLLSTNRPLYVDLPSGQCGEGARLHVGAAQLTVFLLLLQMLKER